MNENYYTTPVSLRKVRITDSFWKNEMELVREEILPYQWDALNDQVEGAEPSFCMRNFQVAGKQNEERKEQGESFEEPQYTFRGFQALPEDMEHLEDKFYGFVFQDSDFYKWVEAVAYSLTQHPDPELEKRADDAIDIVCAAQQEDGYLDTYYIINGKDKIFSNLRDHHELYCFGHLTEGAVAYYQATGKDKLLNAAKRFADYIDNYFGPEEGKCKGYPGHEIAEMALVRLYEATGEKKYLDLSYFFVNERGRRPYYFDGEDHPEKIEKGHEEDLRYFYHQAHVPVRQQDEVTGHAVRGVYLYSGMADLARLYQDRELFDACEKLWDNMVSQKMYITGGIGATHLGEAFSYRYDLPNDTAYAETCAAIGLVFWARRMLQIRPDSKYADAMERALYNGVLSGMALDGRSFFYVNPLEAAPEACRFDERKFHVKPVRQKWFGCACCPPNLARLLSSIGSYAYTEKEDTLYIHLYMGSMVQKEIQGETAEISVTSGYPWNGGVSVKVRGTSLPFTIALRIPEWCADEYQVRGTEGAETRTENGYLYVTKAWGAEDQVELSFPMEVRVFEADSRVREDIGKVAVMRGPVVYCLEEADNGTDLHLLSLDVHAEPEVREREIAGTTVKGIALSGYRQDPVYIEGKGLYRVVKEIKRNPVKLQFVPYYTWANRGENEMRVWVQRAD
ncbi:MAG: glycoside hydrolase family 127 protein [Eubacterium sp.]|nr:glycoside hydrolase family 127 protein [Eubacterium sp.]